MTASSDQPPGLGRALHARFGRLLHSVRVRLKRPVTLGVRLLALTDAGEVLLIRQSYMPGLALPGGGVDPGETCAEAAAREAAEEAGLALAEPPALFHVYLNRALGNRDHVVLFVARGVSRDREWTPSLEILSSNFYPVQALPEAVTPATRARLAEVLEGAPRSDIW